MECVFCLERLTYFTNCRKIPCGHVACLACLSQQVNTTAKTQCSSCRYEFNLDDVNSLKEVSFDAGSPSSDNHELCGVCLDKLADAFCVTCQMSLCSIHKKEDQEKAYSSGELAHYQVKMKQFLKDKDSYKRHYCRVHQDKLTSQACESCVQTFCASCDPQGKCPATDEGHKLSCLSDSVKAIKIQIEELQSVLAEKISRFQSMEKDLARKIECILKQEEQLIAEVNRTVKEQIEQITLEGEGLKAEIIQCTGDFKEKAEALTLQLITATAKAREGMKDLENLARVSIDGLLIEKFSDALKDIKEMISWSCNPIWIPSKQLLPTGSFRSLEVKLEELSPCSIEHVTSVRTGEDSYLSVSLISADLLVTASRDGIEIRDSKLDLVRCINLPDCNDVKPYGDGLVVLQWIRSNQTRKVKFYSRTLQKIKDIVDLPTKTERLSQVAAADGKIVASDPDNKCLDIYSFDGKHLRCIEHCDMINPRGLCITADGGLLVTDYTAKGLVRKYQLRGDYSLIWQSDELLWPWGIVEDNTGLLYTNSYQSNNNFIYQLSPDGRLMKELTCDQLKKTTSTHGISVLGDSLTVSCRDEGLKLFKFKYIE